MQTWNSDENSKFWKDQGILKSWIIDWLPCYFSLALWWKQGSKLVVISHILQLGNWNFKKYAIKRKKKWVFRMHKNVLSDTFKNTLIAILKSILCKVLHLLSPSWISDQPGKSGICKHIKICNYKLINIFKNIFNYFHCQPLKNLCVKFSLLTHDHLMHGSAKRLTQKSLLFKVA